jgi:hypothetical protein
MKLPSIPNPKASTMVRFHFGMAVLWGLLVIPTVLIWKESILWIGFMSIYAIIVSHLTGWDAAKAEQAAED